jgi:uncharacterized membrane protein
MPPHANSHLPIVDVARGLAIAQMVAYHFCYDLNYFGWLHVEMLRDAGWIGWRTAIVGQFVFLMGVSLALRDGPRDGAAKAYGGFRRRWLQIAGCALLVSLASWGLFGARFIWFGVLHFAALAQLLLRPLARRGARAVVPGLVLGTAALAAGIALQFPLFGADGLSWIGFSPVKPQTEDYVPLFPWLGVALLGIAAAQAWQSSASAPAQRLRAANARPLRPLALAGRWPLTIYMLHQPLLFAALDLVAILVRHAA